MTRNSVMATGLTLLLLTGCARPHVLPDVDATGMPNPEQALRHTIEQVNADMAQIGAMGPAAAVPTTTLPAELEREIQFAWQGSLDDGVRKLAQSIGYQCIIARSADVPSLPISVNMAGRVIDVLRAVGDAAGHTATVAVDPIHHQIQVLYHA